MNKKCKKWHKQLQNLRKKHTEFLQTYADALKFAEQNPGIRETSFARCRVLFHKIKPLVLALREHFPGIDKERLVQLSTLKARLRQNPKLHKDILEPAGNKMNPDKIWKEVEKRLHQNPTLIDTLIKMEKTGGEPDLIWYDKVKDQYIFVDCSKETTEGRGCACYDKQAQIDWKQSDYNNKPEGNAIDEAAEIGCELLTEAEYRKLHTLGEFDRDTLNWIKTPDDIRITGKALAGNAMIFGRVDVDRVDAGECGDSWTFRGSLRV